MKKSYLKRATSFFLTLILCMVFTIATTAPVDAASKTKTYQVVTSEKTVSDYDGDKSSYSYHYSYNKYGLLKKTTSNGGKTASKAIYKRNKKGYVTQVKYYSGKKLLGREVYNLKSNGNIKKSTYYIVKGKKSKKQSTSTYKYWSKGKVKQITTKGKGFKTVVKYDKKGNRTYYKDTSGSGSNKSTYTTKSIIEYNEKGDPVKVTDNSTSTYAGETDKFKDITTYTYTYNSKGNPTKRVAVWKMYEGDTEEASSIDTTTYKYKNVKVPKKFWHFFKK